MDQTILFRDRIQLLIVHLLLIDPKQWTGYPDPMMTCLIRNVRFGESDMSSARALHQPLGSNSLISGFTIIFLYQSEMDPNPAVQ